MTSKEALDKLKHIENEYNARTGHPCSDILQELVDKETLKQIEVIANAKGLRYFRCPSCNNFLNYPYNYCCECGQKLKGYDWSDE